MSEPNTATSEAQAANPNAQTAQVATSTAQAAESTNNTQTSTEQNIDIAALQRELKEARADAAKYRTAAKKQEEEAQAAETERLRQQGEFKTLADKHEARVKELQPQLESLTANLTRLSEYVARQIDTAIKDWPKEVKEFDPGPDNLEARLAWVEKARPLADKLKGQSQGAGGNGQRPRPQNTGPAGEAAEIEALKARMRAGGRY